MRIRFYTYLVSIMLFLSVSCKTSSSDLDIIGGKTIPDEKYPTVIKLKNKYHTSFCSGIIVSENVVLTAAHCVVPLTSERKDPRSVYVDTDNNFIEGDHYIYLEEYSSLIPKYNENQEKIKYIQNEYDAGEITRYQYETKVNTIKFEDPTPYDLAAIIFKNIDGTPHFKNIIEKAKNKGVYFNLSKNTFEIGTSVGGKSKDAFFLGFGRSGTYDKLQDLNALDCNISIFKITGKKQIGYNYFMYENNEWSTPRPSKIDTTKYLQCSSLKNEDQYFYNRDFSYLYSKSNTLAGDSGGPLIHKNQIIGLTSRGEFYDCAANKVYIEPLDDKFFDDRYPECYHKVYYVDSYFAPVILGSKLRVVETFFEKIKSKLQEENILENNSIFLELTE